MGLKKTTFVLSMILIDFLLGACTTHTWAPGPDARGTYDEASARCSLIARHSGGEFYASGSQRFVAGAILGAAVGDAIRAQNDFNDCMKASGWVVADTDKASIERAQAANAQVASIRSELVACKEAVRRDPKYAVLLPHLMDNTVGHYTLTQMADGGVPTSAESALLASYGDQTSLCQDRTVAEVSALDPRTGKLLQTVYANSRDVALALINRQITWGDFARRSQSLMDSASGGGAQPSATNVALNGAPPMVGGAPSYSPPIAATTAGQSLVKPSFGVEGGQLTRANTLAMFMPDPRGVIVESLVPTGVAGRAGVRVNDVILSVGGHRVTTVDDLNDQIARVAPGVVTQVAVWRGGKEIDLSAQF